MSDLREALEIGRFYAGLHMQEATKIKAFSQAKKCEEDIKRIDTALAAQPEAVEPVAWRIRVVDGSYCRVIPEGELEVWKQNWSRHLATGHALLEPLGVIETTPPLAPDERMRSALELAYGLLWVVGCDRSTKNGNALYLARKALYEQIDKAGQARGITAARESLAAGADEGKESEGRAQGSLPSGESDLSVTTGCRPSDPTAADVVAAFNTIPPEQYIRPPDATAQREAIARIIGSFPTHPHDGDEQYVLHDAFPGDYDSRTAKVYELTDAVILALQTRAGG